jgi:hypothetical protein
MTSTERQRKLAAIQSSPLWRSCFRAESPDHRFVAEINPAWEVFMGSPMQGTLCLSAGLHVDRCSPVFLWSDDSRYLAVPQFVPTFWRGLRQQLLIVDVTERWIYRSPNLAPYLQPDSFTSGRLTVIRNPHRRPSTLSWRIPEDLPGRFTKKKGMWAHPCPPPAGSAAS